MNSPHQNALTTPLGRAEMTRRITEDAGFENRSSCPKSAQNDTFHLMTANFHSLVVGVFAGGDADVILAHSRVGKTETPR